MRRALGVSAGWADVHGTWSDALRVLRDRIEAVGIIVVVNGVVGNNNHRKLDPEEFRGFVGPPNMSKSALTYYQDKFHQLVSAPGWSDFVNENGSVTQFLDASKFGPFLRQQNESLSTLISSIGLANQ